MNKGISFLVVFLAGMLVTQCRVSREVVKPEAPSSHVGMPGLNEVCRANDTIGSILLGKAETLFIANKNRYEALVTLYSIKDSLIYMSAVNSGFEIIRASVDQDTIRVIDRINKVVYISPVRKKFGYQNPVNFNDIQNIISRYYLCDDLESVNDISFFHLAFQFNEPHIKKSIILNKETLGMDKFEFFHSETRKYFMGERSEEGFTIFSNFMVDEFKIISKGGTVTYNEAVEIKMDVNRRKYTFVNF